MKATASSRIEVRRSTQQVFNERAHLNPAQPIPAASAFDLSAIPATETKQIYDGAATLTIGDATHPVRVRLTGHIDPIDGHYHWQGTVFSPLSDPLPDGALKHSAGGDADGGRSERTRAHRRTNTVGHALDRRGRQPAVCAEQPLSGLVSASEPPSWVASQVCPVGTSG